MNDSLSKVDTSRMSAAQRARSLGGCHVTRAASMGVVSMADARAYYERIGQSAPEPVSERPPRADPLTTIQRKSRGWSVEEDRQLIDCLKRGMIHKDIAKQMRKTSANVQRRVHRLREAGVQI